MLNYDSAVSMTQVSYESGLFLAIFRSFILANLLLFANIFYSVSVAQEEIPDENARNLRETILFRCSDLA
jgi:hypothetical protein